MQTISHCSIIVGIAAFRIFIVYLKLKMQQTK